MALQGRDPARPRFDSRWRGALRGVNELARDAERRCRASGDIECERHARKAQQFIRNAFKVCKTAQCVARKLDRAAGELVLALD